MSKYTDSTDVDYGAESSQIGDCLESGAQNFDDSDVNQPAPQEAAGESDSGGGYVFTQLGFTGRRVLISEEDEEEANRLANLVLQEATEASDDASLILESTRVAIERLAQTSSVRPAAGGSRMIMVSPSSEPTRRRKAVGNRSSGKGLRHFSMKVCEKVESKVRTTYNEVADELVYDMSHGDGDGAHYDEKNIRRRVYDAINVLMALNVIRRERKEIIWCGLPGGAAPAGGERVSRLQAEKDRLLREARRKEEELQSLVTEHHAIRALLRKNAARALEDSACSGTRLYLPFILLQASPETRVEVKLSDDAKEVVFAFDNKFILRDDVFVLQNMRLQDLGQDPEPDDFLGSDDDRDDDVAMEHAYEVSSFSP